MNDILLDSSLYIEDGSFSYEVFPRSIDEFKGKLYAGRMPEKGNEVLLFGQEDKYNFSPAKVKALLDKTFTIYIGEDAASALKIKIVGVAFDRNTDVYKAAGSVYMTNEFCQEMVAGTYYYYSNITTTINGKVQEYINGNPYYKVLPSSRVGKGKILLPKEADNFYKDEEAEGHIVKVRAENMYYDKTVSLKVYDTYTEKSFSYKSNYRSFDKYGGAVFISESDYASLFAKGNYQCSVFVKDLSEIDSTLEALETMEIGRAHV